MFNQRSPKTDMTRHISPRALTKLKALEGLRLSAYLDGANVPTIGYGHTVGVKLGQNCAESQAIAWLKADVGGAEEAVDRLVTVELSESQFGALVIFVFNVGIGAFAGSTLLRKLNAGDYGSVPGELMRWNKITVKGKKVPSPGLSNRRAAECGLWAEGAHVASASVPAVGGGKPMRQSLTAQGTATGGLGGAGLALLDSANQVQAVADYSATLRTVFVVMLVAGTALALYGRWRLSKQEGV